MIYSSFNTLFGFDADETFTPATVREKLPNDFIIACHSFNRSSRGGFFIFTNSARHGIDKMMGGIKFPALVSQGTMCRFETGGEFITHPELPKGLSTTVNEIDKLAKSLITTMAPEYAITTNGQDLHSGRKVLKPEHKDTCYCIVFPETMPDAKKRTDEIVNTINEKLGLSGSFHIHEGRDATEIVPLDQNGNPFDKWKGIQWVMSDERFQDRRLVLAEDSNDSMLKAAWKKYNAYNISVGNGLIKNGVPDHISASRTTIEDFRNAFINVMKGHNETGQIDLNRWNLCPH